MNTMQVVDDTIVEEVTINAPAQRIFNALTNPVELLKWWNLEGKFKAVQAVTDVRPGGKWMMRVEGGCGVDGVSIVKGEYIKIDPPRLIIYSWVREQEDWPESLVRWDIEEANGQCNVRVTHTGLINEAMRARNNGWSLVLSLLDNHITATA